jgi:hypothetical protein
VPVLFTVLFSFALPAAAAQARLSESYGKLPLHFEANQGQMHQDVRFLARGPGYSLYLTSGEAVLVLTRSGPEASPGAQLQGESIALRMSLVGAARKPLVSGLEQLPGKANYFIGKDPAKWRSNVPTYAKVHYRDVYPGIDLVYYGNQRQLEYDFVVAPGADPKKIVLGFKGAEKLEIDAQGDLVLHTGGGAIRQHKPVIYQEVDGVRQEIAGSYVRKGANRIGFKVAAYDRSRPLVIDPVVLSYSTYLGGSYDDPGFGIAVDADGNAYVTGWTYSTDFPTTPEAFQPTFDRYEDAFVTKLNPTGSALVYSTYLGGSGSDRGFGIAVDAAGNAYVTGGTNSDNFPTTAGAFQTTNGWGGAFVTKLDPTGSALVYSTFLGSALGSGIAVDAAGNAYVAGRTSSVNFPTTPGAFQPISRGGVDVFVTKLNPTGSALVYSTYLGGSSSDSMNGIAVDAGGSAYVTGSTNSTDFPTTPGAYQTAFGGYSDAFVTKLNADGSGLIYSTYLGGSSSDAGTDIAVDAAGNAHVTGPTYSTNFPTTAGAFQASLAEGTCSGYSGSFPCPDAFVTKLNPAGSGLIYSTYLGGSSADGGSGIAVDNSGNAYVTGNTNSANFPTTQDAFQTTFGGGADPYGTPSGDVFVTKLNPAGSGLVYSTYLGGSDPDVSSAITMDAAGNIYVMGATDSTDFPITSGAFQPVFAGGGGGPESAPPAPGAYGDTFVAKFSFPTRFEENAATYSGYWTSYGAEIGTFSGGTIVEANHTTASATFSFTGTAVTWIGVKCNVCGIATASIDGGAPTVVNTFGPGVPGSLTSEPVFSASGLAPDVPHTLVITVTGATATTSPLNLLPGNGHVAVDAFDVTR